jgi:hypothetical protein
VSDAALAGRHPGGCPSASFLTHAPAGVSPLTSEAVAFLLDHPSALPATLLA